MPAYIFILAIDEVEEAKRYRSLPLHCTLLHWFDLPATAEQQLAHNAHCLFASIDPITITAQAPELFGEDRDVPVHTIRPTSQLLGLHASLLETATALGATMLHPQYVGTGYRPHVTTKSNRVLLPGRCARCQQAYLATSEAPDNLSGGRHIVRTFTLGQGH